MIFPEDQGPPLLAKDKVLQSLADYPLPPPLPTLTQPPSRSLWFIQGYLDVLGYGHAVDDYPLTRDQDLERRKGRDTGRAEKARRSLKPSPGSDPG